MGKGCWKAKVGGVPSNQLLEHVAGNENSWSQHVLEELVAARRLRNVKLFEVGMRNGRDCMWEGIIF